MALESVTVPLVLLVSAPAPASTTLTVPLRTSYELAVNTLVTFGIPPTILPLIKVRVPMVSVPCPVAVRLMLPLAVGKLEMVTDVPLIMPEIVVFA